MIDKAVDATLHVAYDLALEDTEYTMGDIVLPDAKTHQFFAFNGALSLVGFDYELRRFDGPLDEATHIPLWITVDDVKRAAQASGTIDGTNFSQADVPEGAVLQNDAMLTGVWQRVTQDDARVPITFGQAAMGVSWDLGGVAPGLYSFAGYIFSPPYNGWAAHPSLIKVTDPDNDPPAVLVKSVRGTLFSYQGWRVRGCADVTENVRMSAFFRVQERPEEGWMPWLEDLPLASGEFEHCFHDPRPELTGSVQLRFDVTAEDGSVWSFYSPDTVTAISGTGSCESDESVCCDAAHVATSSGCEGGASCSSPGELDSGATGSLAGRPGTDASARAQSERSAGDGCSVAVAALPSRLGSAGLVCACLLWLGVRSMKKQYLQAHHRRRR